MAQQQTTRIWCERSRCLIEVPVAWRGDRRDYLTIRTAPTRVMLAPLAPREMRVSDKWLAGEHYRETDAARQRMSTSARCANAPFTVAELAQAARVSRTLVRRFLALAQRRGECHRVGRRPRARTFADLFVFGVAPVIELSVAWGTFGDLTERAE